jgi:hypothetical protein
MGLSNNWLGFCGYCEKICDENNTIITECNTVLCEECTHDYASEVYDDRDGETYYFLTD